MSKPLLALSFPGSLSPEKREAIMIDLDALAERIGAESVVLEAGASMALHTDLAPVVEAIQAQTEAVRQLAHQLATPQPSRWTKPFRWWANDNPGAAGGHQPIGVIGTPAPPPREL